MSSASDTSLSDADGALLLDTAADALEFAVLRGGCMQTVPERYPWSLRRQAACFVSLHRQGRLRGCIGTLEPTRPLITDVAENAAAAATRDDRFPPVQPEEIEDLEIEISILGPPTPLRATFEDEVLSALQPGVHGVILEAASGRATFLPTVWEQVPQPRAFLAALKEKAGWSPDSWPPDTRVFTYTTERVGPV